ncbi:MAG: hypothetical protein UH229_05600 [Lachnospiraceae bacterium]|nr:hypothetical protein [Lachnospiraceae bacterium]
MFTSCGASGADSDSGEPRKVTVITELNLEDESASDESADEMEEANIFSELIREDGTVDVTKVPHLYFYPLINDYRAFDPEVVSGARITVNNSNNLTPAEFREILEKLYAAGFMLVRFTDLFLIEETPGGLLVSPNEKLVLPEGKLPLLLTEDNVNYHHSTDNTGYASKIVLKNGKLSCAYVNANGTEKTGDYDAVPILESFIEKHPDFSYEGARMTLALTGYNGVLGYRTDESYRTRAGLTELQQKWLEEHPDFDYDAEVAAAKETAAALKAAGYEFANKTWGDRIVSSATLTDLKVDLQKWKASVTPILGDVKIFVFGHDSDIEESGGYSADNNKFSYYTSEGYCIFCVSGRGLYTRESSGRNYVRSVRFPLTPYALKTASTGVEQWTAQTLWDLGVRNIAAFLDPERPDSYVYIS